MRLFGQFDRAKKKQIRSIVAEVFINVTYREIDFLRQFCCERGRAFNFYCSFWRDFFMCMVLYDTFFQAMAYASWLKFQLRTLRLLYVLDEQELIERSYVDILSTHARHWKWSFVCSLHGLLFSLVITFVRWGEMAADKVIETCDYHFHFIQSCLSLCEKLRSVLF